MSPSSPLIRPFDGSKGLESLFSLWAQRPHTIRLQGGWQPGGLGRFTFLGIDPYATVSAQGSRILYRDADGTRTIEGDPFSVLARLYAPVRSRAIRADLPFGFQGGAMGYFGYDLRHFVEEVPGKAEDDLGLPDMEFAFFDVVCVYDHKHETGYLLSSGLPLEGRAARERARRRLDGAWHDLSHTRDVVRGPGAPTLTGDPAGVLAEGYSAFDKPGYLRAVQKAKAYIQAGDIYQANVAQRFSVPLPCDPETLFHILRVVNPSPFGAYLRGADWCVVSVSPERFLHCDGVRVQTRPIKGTRPRGATPQADERLRIELQASEKDRAEHVMIVDLERNDLGRFCRYGSVRVPELMVCEDHPTVWHLVSAVEGTLRDEAGIIEGIRASFPGGSITGAPKVRAMEIIDELEPVRRGVYTGAIGYLGAGGRVDLNIAIRTITVKGDRAYFHVGGGIVADSDPESEYQETLDKGLGIARALAAAQGAGGGVVST